MPVKALSRGQLAESTARKKGKGRHPGGPGCPQAARSGNRTLLTFSARLLELMSQGCRGLTAPQGQLTEVQPENTGEGGSLSSSPSPASTQVRKNLREKAASSPSWEGLWGSPRHQGALGTLRTSQGPLGVPPLGPYG